MAKNTLKVKVWDFFRRVQQNVVVYVGQSEREGREAVRQGWQVQQVCLLQYQFAVSERVYYQTLCREMRSG